MQAVGARPVSVVDVLKEFVADLLRAAEVGRAVIREVVTSAAAVINAARRTAAEVIRRAARTGSRRRGGLQEAAR